MMGDTPSACEGPLEFVLTLFSASLPPVRTTFYPHAQIFSEVFFGGNVLPSNRAGALASPYHCLPSLCVSTLQNYRSLPALPPP
jgi:hypothetical protein